jgi:YihY family inner membrane protein
LLRTILDSAVGQFPIVGNQLSDPRGVSGTGTGLVVGIVGTLYGSLGFAQAIQNAMNAIWRVPRHRRPNPIFSRLRSVLLIVSIAVGSVLTTGVTVLGTNFNQFPVVATIGIAIGSCIINALLFTAAFWFATARDMTWSETVPGAVGAAVLWQFLQIGATSYVNHVVKHASSANGVFALVLGLLAWLYLQSLVVVLAAEFNTVRSQRLYPRALMTIFTDDVQLTDADREAYTDQAEAQQAKGFETIEVTFHEDPRDR